MVEFRQAAKKGNLLAMERYGCHLTRSVKDVDNIDQLLEDPTTFLLPPAQAGLVDAQYALAEYSLMTGLVGDAYVWYARAAKKGHLLAIAKMLSKYRNHASRASRANRENYLTWLVHGAQCGDANMQNRLGYLLLFPHELHKDVDEAEMFNYGITAQANKIWKVWEEKQNLSMYWFGRAAKQGHMQAQAFYAISLFCKPFWNIDANYWLIESIKSGSLLAMAFLGDLFKNRSLFENDFMGSNKAYSRQLLKLAVNGGFIPAAKILAQNCIVDGLETEAIHWLKVAITRGPRKDQENCAFKLGKLLFTKKRNIDVALELIIAGTPTNKTEIDQGPMADIFSPFVTTSTFDHPRIPSIQEDISPVHIENKTTTNIVPGEFICFLDQGPKETYAHVRSTEYDFHGDGVQLNHVSEDEKKSAIRLHGNHTLFHCFNTRTYFVDKVFFTGGSGANDDTGADIRIQCQGKSKKVISLVNTPLARALNIYLHKTNNYRHQRANLLLQYLHSDVAFIVLDYLTENGDGMNSATINAEVQSLAFTDKFLLTRWPITNYASENLEPIWSDKCQHYLHSMVASRSAPVKYKFGIAESARLMEKLNRKRTVPCPFFWFN